MNGEAVAKIMEVWARMTRACTQSDRPDQAEEYRDHGGIAEGCPADGNEHCVIYGTKLIAQCEVTLQAFEHGLVQRYQTGLTEFGLSDNQPVVGNISELQRQRFRTTQAGGRQQREKCSI